MEIIITKTFKKDFFEIFTSKSAYEFFISKIKNDSFINLNSKYKKFKFDIGNISLRGIIYFRNDKFIYIPTFIVKKSDKKYGMNLTLTKEFLEILDNKMIKHSNDIKNLDYELF